MIQNVCVPSGNWDCRFDQTISERKKQELIIVGAWSGRGPAVVRPNFGVVRVFFAVERLNFAVVPGTPKIAQNDKIYMSAYCGNHIVQLQDKKETT